MPPTLWCFRYLQTSERALVATRAQPVIVGGFHSRCGALTQLVDAVVTKRPAAHRTKGLCTISVHDAAGWGGRVHPRIRAIVVNEGWG